jgi:hypothetical protein
MIWFICLDHVFLRVSTYFGGILLSIHCSAHLPSPKWTQLRAPESLPALESKAGRGEVTHPGASPKDTLGVSQLFSTST